MAMAMPKNEHLDLLVRRENTSHLYQMKVFRYGRANKIKHNSALTKEEWF